jgi:Na+/phosphate symporter
MYEEAIIKVFETSRIKVKTTIYEKFTFKTASILIIVFGLMCGFLYMGTAAGQQQPVDNITLFCIIGISVFIGLTTAMMMSITGFGYDHIPSYQIHLVGRSNSLFDAEISQAGNILIPITTLEKDQVAICKAAQSLEPIAQEFDEKAQAIKKIADKCKEVKA